jgi:aspartate/methionine/tyrosine aminotransferase
MQAIAELGPLVVSDEIYHGLSYEGPDRTILEFTDGAFVLNGFSKAFAMTGWRLGYVIAPRAYVRALQKAYQNFFISTNEFVQWAGVAALREAKEEARRFRRIFDERRRAMIAGVRHIGLGVGVEPTGAFYVFANARRFTSDSRAFAFDLVDHAHVGVTPGVDFGANAEGYLRFSYASSIERIEEGLRRIGAYLAQRDPPAGG